MAGSARDRLRGEFATVSRWLAEAALSLPEETRPMAVCRGTGHPEVIERIADLAGVTSETRVLDAGCGLGGPGMWLRRTRGCPIVGIDLMPEQIAALAALFPAYPAVAGSLEALPFAAGCFEAVLVLGSLELVEDKAAALVDLARVLEPGGRLALYTYLARESGAASYVTSDYFVTPGELREILRSAGLTTGPFRRSETSPRPREWIEAASVVQAEVKRLHGGAPEYADVLRELDGFNRARDEGSIAAWELVCSKT